MSPLLHSDLTSCEDAAVLPHCYVDSRVGALVRTNCPVTCGCNSPSSLQILTHPNGGCPSPCFKSESYRTELGNAPCSEMNANDLIVLPHWIELAKAIAQVGVVGLWMPAAVSATRIIWQNMLTKGCGAIPIVLNLTMIDMCDESDGRGLPLRSLRLSCPVTCKCMSRPFTDRANCPRACYES
mmetsp:Transcript_62841/g.112248  ORF Transcript_62841/g.112248 Transcript_62841/m.112248 type:complete len:183 (-) Transcript_62841:40-588(-)